MAGQPDNHIAADGAKRIVEYARLEDGSMPAKQFFESLPKADRAKFMALWRRTALCGEIERQPRKFKREEGPLFAFKADAADGRMIRFGCFRRGNRWILAHGFYKPAQNRWPQSAVNKCYANYNTHVKHWEKEGT